jgi:hypothetical protein
MNLVLAHMWASLAIRPGYDLDPEPISIFRDKVESEMTPEQVMKAHSLAKEWTRCPKSAIDVRPDLDPDDLLMHATLWWKVERQKRKLGNSVE